MKTYAPPARHGFTLLEMIIVLAITALLLSAIYTLSNGVLVLAEDVRITQQRQSRQQALVSFCEHLFSNLPANTALNLRTTQDGGQYLTKVEFEPAPSPFDGSPNGILALYTEPMTGGGLRLGVSWQRRPPAPPQEASVILFEDLSQCDWRVFDLASNQWVTVWREQPPPVQSPLVPPPPPAPNLTPGPAPPVVPPPVVLPPVRSAHPVLIELRLAAGIDDLRRWVFWLPPSELPPG